MRTHTRNLYQRAHTRAAVAFGIVSLISSGLFLSFMINVGKLIQIGLYPDAIANGFFAFLTGFLALIMASEAEIRIQKARGYSQSPYHK